MAELLLWLAICVAAQVVIVPFLLGLLVLKSMWEEHNLLAAQAPKEENDG